MSTVREVLTLAGRCEPETDNTGLGPIYRWPCGLAVDPELGDETAEGELDIPLRQAHLTHHIDQHPRP